MRSQSFFSIFWYSSVFCFLIALGCTTPSVLEDSQSLSNNVKEYKHIKLLGNRPGMVNTGISLNEGDAYTIFATGSVDLWPGGPKYHDVRPEHGWPFMARIGDKTAANRYFCPLRGVNASTQTARSTGDLYLGIRDGPVDIRGEPLNPGYYSRNEGSFNVDIIVWKTDDWTQMAEFFQSMKHKYPDNEPIIHALEQANRYAEKKMTLKEAKQVTVSMSEKPFVPPPRRIDDILSILDQPGHFDTQTIARHKLRADTSPPDTVNPVELAKFYFRRGRSARELGRSKQSLEDLRKALQYCEMLNEKKAGRLKALILGSLSQVEAEFGNFYGAIAANKQALEIYPLTLSHAVLMSQYMAIGDLKAAEEVKESGIQLCDDLISNPTSNEFKRTWAEIIKNHMQAMMLAARGKYAQAESHRRYMMKLLADPGKKDITIRRTPRTYLMLRNRLAMSLLMRRRLIEAELEAREALKESIALGGKESETTGKILSSLGKIFLSQGRLNDAEAISRAVIRILESSGVSNDSARMASAMMMLGAISVAKLDFAEAMKHYDSAKQGMLDNKFFYEDRFTRSPHMILSLLKTGRTEEAMALISKWYSKYNAYFGKKRYRTALMLGLRGMANAMMGNEAQALKDFSESVPLLLEKTGDESPYMKSLRLKIIVESYLDLLTKIHESKRGKEFGVNTSAEIFKLCQGISGSIVQDALGASGARAAAVDPELADLVRKEQDALKQINALQAILSDAIAAPQDQQKPDALEDLRATIVSLSNARSVLLDEIKRRFPKYADFTDPQPVGFSKAQKNLLPDEALIVIFSTMARTYVWAIPYKGETQFAVIPLNEGDLLGIIVQLRKALDIDPGTFGDIPEFDLSRAYTLYSQLFRSVVGGWKDAKDLIVIAHGPLAQLPFSVLPTNSVTLSPEKHELFSNYRKVPWLIRKVSITRQPSVSSFITLRELPAGDPDRRAFAGFGDPIFNKAQLAMEVSEKGSRQIDLASRGKRVHVRGIRVTEKGDLDSKQILSCHLDSLNRLPDTAEEIKSIAHAMGADPAKDIFLGKRASEKQVKTMNLSNRQVIAFASHALVPGDLDGLYQPAIALSAPSVTGDNEDGLLTMEEVLKLRLNTDWVVLSACNTGAADGTGAEALSGLGRAFFYAGTRAILASMWPVETSSAKELTTGLFRSQKENKNLSRVRAHQKSMLALIDSPGLLDNTTGKIVASYAHPFFWAPFILVGDGR